VFAIDWSRLTSSVDWDKFLATDSPSDKGRVLYEDHHGQQLTDELRKHYNAVFRELRNKITGPLKAKIIRVIAKQAAPQLKAGVPPRRLQFTPDPHIESMLDKIVEDLYKRASFQAKHEVRSKRGS